MRNKHRPLTHDERKAAEAAFQGAAFDPQLSESARRIYLGISSALADKRNASFQKLNVTSSATTAQKGSKETQTRRRTKSILW